MIIGLLSMKRYEGINKLHYKTWSIKLAKISKSLAQRPQWCISSNIEVNPREALKAISSLWSIKELPLPQERQLKEHKVVDKEIEIAKDEELSRNGGMSSMSKEVDTP